MATVRAVCIVRDKDGDVVVLRPGDTVPAGVKITNPAVLVPARKKKETSK